MNVIGCDARSCVHACGKQMQILFHVKMLFERRIKLRLFYCFKAYQRVTIQYVFAKHSMCGVLQAKALCIMVDLQTRILICFQTFSTTEVFQMPFCSGEYCVLNVSSEGGKRTVHSLSLTVLLFVQVVYI